MRKIILLLSFLLCSNSFAAESEPKNSESKNLTAIANPYPKISENGFADIVETLLPAVVNISTFQKLEAKDSQSIEEIIGKLPETESFKEFKDLLEKEITKTKRTASLGSGFIISKDGYIVTNQHVIEDATKITINLSNTKSFEAKLIGVDKRSDLALLKIESSEDLPYVKLGNSDKSRIGEWVIAVGNPFGLGGSVSVGIISGHNRNINSEKFDDYIQTDAAINRGNSGGPLFNINGEVIGIATAIFSPSGGNVGIGFATPSSTAALVINQLKTNGEVTRGWIGVSINDVSEEMAKAIGLDKAQGAFVADIFKGGPAEKAGILPSDLIVKFDDKTINEMKDLPKIVSQTPVGKVVEIEILRQGKTKILEIKVNKLDESKIKKASEEDSQIIKSKATDSLLSMDLVDLTKNVKRENKIAQDLEGILIVKVKEGDIADEKGLEKGDIILSANQTPISSIADLKKIIAQSKEDKKESIFLFLKREKLIKDNNITQQKSFNFAVVLPLK